MRRLFFFLFLLIAVFATAFIVTQELERKRFSVKAPAISQHFHPVEYTLESLPFTIVITGRNNGAHIEKTLDSVFSQNYENFRVIYVDDASDDGSFDLAKDLIYSSSHLGKVTIVQNEERIGSLANISRAVQTCEDGEIVVVLGDEDFLAHEWVLQRLNSYYANSDLWFTLSQSRDYPSYQISSPCEIASKEFRKEPVPAVCLKSFYAALFKKIRESDFVFAGEYLETCTDLAYVIPMLELAKDHFCFVDETMYIHNTECVKKEDLDTLLRFEKYIRSLDPYSSLSMLEVNVCGE